MARAHLMLRRPHLSKALGTGTRHQELQAGNVGHLTAIKDHVQYAILAWLGLKQISRYSIVVDASGSQIYEKLPVPMRYCIRALPNLLLYVCHYACRVLQSTFIGEVGDKEVKTSFFDDASALCCVSHWSA